MEKFKLINDLDEIETGMEDAKNLLNILWGLMFDDNIVELGSEQEKIAGVLLYRNLYTYGSLVRALGDKISEQIKSTAKLSYELQSIKREVA